MFGVQKASLNMFWEYLPSPADEEERKRKQMMMSILDLLHREFIYLLTSGQREAQPCQNDTVLS